MKIQGTPEEMEQAKNWWKDQKKRIDEEYKEAKKKDPNARKYTSLVSPENKERTYRRHEVGFSQIKGDNMKYLDLVELIKEKPAYIKAGVKVGDFGAIMSEKPINGKWQVVFSEFYTGKDIADIMVAEEDLKVHDSVPKDRYPKKII